MRLARTYFPYRRNCCGNRFFNDFLKDLTIIDSSTDILFLAMKSGVYLTIVSLLPILPFDVKHLNILLLSGKRSDWKGFHREKNSTIIVHTSTKFIEVVIVQSCGIKLRVLSHPPPYPPPPSTCSYLLFLHSDTASLQKELKDLEARRAQEENPSGEQEEEEDEDELEEFGDDDEEHEGGQDDGETGASDEYGDADATDNELQSVSPINNNRADNGYGNNPFSETQANPNPSQYASPSGTLRDSASANARPAGRNNSKKNSPGDIGALPRIPTQDLPDTPLPLPLPPPPLPSQRSRMPQSITVAGMGSAALAVASAVASATLRRSPPAPQNDGASSGDPTQGPAAAVPVVVQETQQLKELVGVLRRLGVPVLELAFFPENQRSTLVVSEANEAARGALHATHALLKTLAPPYPISEACEARRLGVRAGAAATMAALIMRGEDHGRDSRGRKLRLRWGALEPTDMDVLLKVR